jgi:hypothetical protein
LVSVRLRLFEKSFAWHENNTYGRAYVPPGNAQNPTSSGPLKMR